MCKQRTAVILISISIVVMMAAMFYLLMTTDYSRPIEPARLKSSKFVPTRQVCSEIRQKCLTDNQCRTALNYIERFCLYSDENTFCNSHCQTMVTCLSLNVNAKNLFECQCKTLGLSEADRRVQLQNNVNMPSSSAWCFPLNTSWCKPDFTRNNINSCDKLRTCDPYKSLCGANLTISGCEHIALSASMNDECKQLFENQCTDLCHLITKTAWVRTQMMPLHKCICENFPIPCDFERRIVLNHCLLGKKTI